MEYLITNLRAEKAADGKIYITFVNGQISDYRVCIGVIGQDSIKYEADGAVRRAIK